MSEDLVEEIMDAEWTQSHSYNDFAPHQYISREDFPVLCRLMDYFILNEGKVEKFYFPQGNKEYTYFYIAGKKYWYTNYGLILNRCDAEVNASYGVNKEEANSA